jgi:hypothetical protein
MLRWKKRIRLTDGEKKIEGSITTSKQLDACAGNRKPTPLPFLRFVITSTKIESRSSSNPIPPDLPLDFSGLC